MLGLILGDSKFGNIIINKLKKKKKNFIIIDISKRNIHKSSKTYFLSIGELGKALSILKKNKCKQVLFAGRVSTPNFRRTKFDLKALYYLPRIIKGAKKGDSSIIKEMIKIFNHEGFKVINSLKFNPELIMRKKNYTNIKINNLYKKDIEKGIKTINSLTKINPKIGQAVVIKNGSIVSIEDAKGTDNMINKIKTVDKGSVLVKLPKKNQDLRIDLPTIGIKTIKKCIKKGFKGIALKANKSIFLDKKQAIRLANKRRIFICGV